MSPTSYFLLPTSYSLVFCIQPVVPHAHIHDQRDLERRGALHVALDQHGHRLDLGPGRLEDELVVDLQQQPARQPLLPERPVEAHHRDLDEIRRGALERGILRLSLAECAQVEVLVPDLGDIAPTPEEGLDVSARSGTRTST